MPSPTRIVTPPELENASPVLTVGAIPQTTVRHALKVLMEARALAAAGYDPGPSFAKAAAVVDALDADRAKTLGNTQIRDLSDPLALSPEQAVTMARGAAIDSALGSQALVTESRYNELQRRIDDAFADAFRTESDTACVSMRPDFDQAAAVIAAAHKANLTPATTHADLVENGTDKQLAAYRAMPAAVATLNRLATLRLRLCNVASAGPTEHPVATIVAVSGRTDAEAAASVYAGTNETVLVPVDHPAAMPIPRVVVKPRLGGPWLALVAAGYRLRLATSAEADAAVERG